MQRICGTFIAFKQAQRSNIFVGIASRAHIQGDPFKQTHLGILGTIDDTKNVSCSLLPI